MTTYADMQARIADEIADTSLASQIKSAIQSAIKHYERKRFYFNQTIGTFNTVAGQEYYDGTALADIPNLINIDWMKLQLGGGWVDVVETSFIDIESSQTGVYVGVPSYFTYYTERIRLMQIPDAIYPIRLSYHYRLPALVNDSDTNAWMTDAEELIRQRAKLIIGKDVTREIPMDAPPGQLEQDALAALKMETRKRLSSERLRTEVYQMAGTRRFSIISGDVR